MRRFSITKEQGELIQLALLNFMEDIRRFQANQAEYSPYWDWRFQQANSLYDKLSSYDWYK